MISCTPTKYIIVTESELNNIDLGNSLLNIIPISDMDYQNDILINKTCNFLKNKQRRELRAFLDNINPQNMNSSYFLSNSMYYINKCDYKTALVNLRKIDTTQFKPIRELLLIDVTYEINKEIGLTDYQRYLKEYQTLIDKYPENEQLKKIVAIRLRYLRYNY